jgi:superfamily I DNA/RNA helicase
MSGAWWVGASELNEEQRNVIALPLAGSHLVTGPPGSGKTNILLLRARHLTLSGKHNILIVVFTKTLQKFIASGGHNYGFSSDKIVTCNRWQRGLIYEDGLRVELPNSFDDQRRVLSEKLGEMIERRNMENIYDAILLDEAQDYTPDEIRIFRRLGTQLFAVADSRQKIYQGEDPLETLQGVVDRAHHLQYHYRNGLKICALADAIAKISPDYKLLKPYSNYDEVALPSSVNVYKESIEHQCASMANALRQQLRAYPDELLGVVCPTNEVLSEIWSRLQDDRELAPRMSQVKKDDDAFEPGKTVCVCTIHAVKGLEVRALHMAGMDHIKTFPHQRNIAFTAVTRAKTSLNIYHEAELPGFLQSAIQSLNAPPRPPKLDALFGGGQ